MSKNQARFSYSNLADYRKALGMTQTKFWKRLGVTQSAGSRYEKRGSNNIPNAVKLLLALISLNIVTDDSIDKARKAIVKASQ